ncbi:hypothetical protein PYCCODRAFT_685156 [Trametes coccinea BRFM310]|uniref:Uncharacterized protein n=1 Tax=Trametes coccinea (strain BRFM310) TaxID=1353009 RepID=A0A1Y2IH65_TRAC3|nr:hypothetical protein PYCCODRAFT_685156 [Trametes coccinea BRFM310]
MALSQDTVLREATDDFHATLRCRWPCASACLRWLVFSATRCGHWSTIHEHLNCKVQHAPHGSATDQMSSDALLVGRVSAFGDSTNSGDATCCARPPEEMSAQLDSSIVRSNKSRRVKMTLTADGRLIASRSPRHTRTLSSDPPAYYGISDPRLGSADCFAPLGVLHGAARSDEIARLPDRNASMSGVQILSKDTMLRSWR